MTIRYKCEECGSVLKIKDELAGTDGRCPKCKSEFTVPDAGEGTSQAAQETAVVDDADAEFDPVAFLMDEGQNPAKSKPAAGGSATDAPAKSGKRRLRKRPAAAVTDDPEPPSPAAVAAAAVEEALPSSVGRRAPPQEKIETSAASSADAMLQTDAAENARGLLTKSMEESRLRAAEMPEEEAKPGIDYIELGRELGLRIAPVAGGCVLAVLAAYWFGYHMVGGGGVDLPPLADVSGVVTKGGEPLAGAEVIFEPIDLKTGSAGAVTEEDGSYELYYIEGIEGAVVGKNRVQVSKIGENGRDAVPPRTDYGFGSNEIHTVEEGSNEINIEIP